MLGMNVCPRFSSPSMKELISFGPFNYNMPRRWKKLVDSARTRLEYRTRDLRLDKLMTHLKKLSLVLGLQELMLKRRGHYVSVQLLSRWRNIVGLNTGIGVFLRKYPHIFEIYIHPVKRNPCCKLTQKMAGLIEEEARIIKETEFMAVQRLKKLLMMSTSRTLHIHALWLIRRELGLPDDFRNSVLLKYTEDFSLVTPEIVSLASEDESLAQAQVEKWREKEYRENWLSDFETKYAFPVQFPTGFKIEKGFREELKNWQGLKYLKPYEKMEVVRVRTCGGIQRFEKRAVAIIHELLSLTVENMVVVERLTHFRKDFSMEVNVRELLLKHPGIFYISTKGKTQTLFLRESYTKGCLVEPNPIYAVRRKMLDLVLQGCRGTNQLQPLKELQRGKNQVSQNELVGGPYEGDWIIPILENCDEQNVNIDLHGSSDEERQIE